MFGTAPEGCSVFGLPGNPVSAFVAYWLVMHTALVTMQGRGGGRTALVRATLDGRAPATDRRQGYWPVQLRPDDDGRLMAKALSWAGSGDPFGMSAANGFLVRRPHSPAARSGEPVEVLVLRWP